MFGQEGPHAGPERSNDVVGSVAGGGESEEVVDIGRDSPLHPLQRPSIQDHAVSSDLGACGSDLG